MTPKKSNLTPTRISRIRAQGYIHQTDAEITELAFGNRFAYRLCVSLLIIGVLFANIPILAIMMSIAFAGVILPHHPFDYLYNKLLAHRMGKPQLPPRSAQLKFACSMATISIGACIYFFYMEMNTAGYVMGLSLITVATLVSTIDLCLPSVIYNATIGKMENHNKKEDLFTN